LPTSQKKPGNLSAPGPFPEGIFNWFSLSD
jgi:hypothetical protein